MPPYRTQNIIKKLTQFFSKLLSANHKFPGYWYRIKTFNLTTEGNGNAHEDMLATKAI
jgi:hypothetical protein